MLQMKQALLEYFGGLSMFLCSGPGLPSSSTIGRTSQFKPWLVHSSNTLQGAGPQPKLLDDRA